MLARGDDPAAELNRDRLRLTLPTRCRQERIEPHLRLITGDAVDSLDRDQVTFDHIQDPVPADAQPMVPAPVKSFSGKRIISQADDGRSDGAHTTLILQVTAR